MRPIELHLQAFGQYLQPQTLRFDGLDSVFLIAGETGAGKTTLFDAMSYALYGVGLGARGGKGSGIRLRSQLAADDVSTVVRFTFAVRGVHWQVERSPYQFVRRVRTGRAESDSYVTLRRITGPQAPEVVAPAEADAKVKELLGLSQEDFAKILVLPQGEFQKFLEMESANRAELLKKLFPVLDHVAITEAAKEAAASASQRIAEIDAVIANLTKNLPFKELSEGEPSLLQTIAALRDDENAKHETLQRARAELQSATELCSQIKELARQTGQLAAHEALRPEHERRQDTIGAAQRAAAVAPLLQAAETLAAEHTTCKTKLSEATDKETAAQASMVTLQPLVDALAGREERLRAEVVAADALQKRAEELDKLVVAIAGHAAAEKLHKAASDGLAKSNQAVEAAKQALTRLEELAAQREAERPALQAAEAEVNRCKLAESDASAVADWSKREPAARADIVTAQHRVTELRTAMVSAEAAQAAANARIRQNAALTVAAALQPGEPCAACGSPTHPNPCRGDREDADLLAVEKLAASALKNAQDAVAAQERLADQMRTTVDLQATVAREAHARLVQAGFADPTAWQAAALAAQTHLAGLRDADASLGKQLAQRPARLAELAKHEQEQTRLRTAAADRGEELASASTKLADLRERLGALAADPLTERERVEVGLQSARAANRAEAEAIEALRKKGQDAAQACAVARTNRARLQEQDEDLAVRAPAARAAADQALADHQFADAEQARAAARTPAQLQALQAQSVTWQSRLDQLTAAIAQLNETVAGRPAPDLASAQTAVTDAEAAAKQAIELRTTREGELASLRDRYKNLDERKAARDQLQAESGGLVTLAKHLNGDVAPRIDFATWMLTWWLEQVLVAANRRMATLSEGRYAFALRTTVQDRRTRAGLDVDVVDSWSNHRRDVRSLSGGEKFLAALSLALGLADIVQGRNAGVQLDTLFIDEGFGGLDGGTLDRAMDLVNRVAEHRAVGIISHVEAMQKAISSQIRVTKSPRGSTVAVVGAGP